MLLLRYGSLCSVSLPCNVMDWSVIYDCNIYRPKVITLCSCSAEHEFSTAHKNLMAFFIGFYAYAIIVHTRALQLLPQLLMKQFDTLMHCLQIH